jgi:hypothetical protein
MIKKESSRQRAIDNVCVCVCVCVCVRACLRVGMHKCICIFIHTRIIHTAIRACIHTYMHTYHLNFCNRLRRLRRCDRKHCCSSLLALPLFCPPPPLPPWYQKWQTWMLLVRGEVSMKCGWVFLGCS